jgi:subtilisin family serine protease
VNCPWYSLGCYHGTHVAGIAAGSGTSFSGVAPDTRIAAIQVFTRFDDATSCQGTPPCLLTSVTDQVHGLERVLALRSAGVNLVAANMSLGGGRYYDYCDTAGASRKAIIDNLRSLGVATVISSGNNGFTDSIGIPGCISSAVSVGSTTDSDTVSSFSNRASFLALMAPGSSIYSSVPGGYDTLNGTSMAAPHVTGACVLVWSVNPTWTSAQVRSKILSTTRPLASLAGKCVTGGILNANAAVR